MAEIKLKDIAAKCGISISTVSRILSGDTSRKANEETARKIVETARQMGYFDEKSRRVFQGGTGFSLGCIFISDHETVVSPFFSEVVRGIQSEVSHLSRMIAIEFHTVNIAEPGFEESIEKLALDCAVILGRAPLSIIDFLKTHIPCLLYAGLNSIGGMDEVLCDARSGMAEAVAYLHSLGHDRIAYVGPADRQSNVYNEHRFDGYLKGMRRAGLSADTQYEDVYLSASDGYEGAERLFSQETKPTAVVCANDMTAIGVMKYLRDAGLRVPDDVSVIGFDNIESSAYMQPALTTFDVPKLELGRLAVKTLVDRKLSPRTCDITVNLPFTLIVRQSCKEVPHDR